MHFITGGAFNGKREWVKKNYSVTTTWISAYHEPLPSVLFQVDSNFLVLEGIERWLKELAKSNDSYKCREIWNQTINHWVIWEQEKPERKLVVIGTDITKGIVPVDREDRVWRDITGWAYQDLSARADKIDIIWYGCNQTIKKVEE